MPAVTADTLTLARVSTAHPADTERPVRSITTGPHGYEGEGFPVVRAFAGVSAAALDPFVHMDQMGEVEYQPGEPRGTDWHPHRGFETVTYMIDGRFAHQDSHGGGGMITDGATQWMTAGAGILHIETPPADLVESGGPFHGIQLWVNLPKKDKFAAPRYQAIGRTDVALLSSDDGGALIRVIAGDIDGHGGPGVTHTPITMAHATVEPGARLNIPWHRDYNALVYVLSGRGSVGPVGHPIQQGQLAVLGPGDRITVAAAPSQESRRPALEVLILGGQPIRQPVFHYGPFVMNSKAELVQAFEDFQAGKFGSIPPRRIDAAQHRAATVQLITTFGQPSGQKCDLWHNLSVVQPASRGPGRPPAAKAAETRKRILRAAREVFSERGYDAATFQAIAIRADLTRPAINHYFSNKRALYREVAKETNAVVVAASIERAQRETTLIARVIAFIDAATQADIENRTAAAFLIIVALESQRHPELSHEEADSVRTTREFLSRAVDDAINRGELAADADAAALTETLIAVLLGVGFYAGFVAKHELDTVTRQLHQLLAGSLARRPEKSSDVAHRTDS